MENKVLNENEERVGKALIKILDEWETLFDDDNVPGGNKFNKNLIYRGKKTKSKKPFSFDKLIKFDKKLYQMLFSSSLKK